MSSSASSQRKHKKLTLVSFVLAVFGMILLLSVMADSSNFRAYAEIPSTYTSLTSQPTIDVNLTSGQILRIAMPSSSNVSVLSLSGGQYDLGLYTSGSKNYVLFTPAQIANYSLALNISSSGSNSASLSELGTTPTTWTKNITGTGNLILNLTVIVLPEPVSASSGWNPLFGFTGISLGGVTLDTTDILAIFAIFSVSLMLIGIKRSQKLVYTGLFFLSLIGMIVVGILVVGAIIGVYVAGFLVIKSYFGFRSRKHNGI